jgi:hypothetical protein
MNLEDKTPNDDEPSDPANQAASLANMTLKSPKPGTNGAKQKRPRKAADAMGGAAAKDKPAKGKSRKKALSFDDLAQATASASANVVSIAEARSGTEGGDMLPAEAPAEFAAADDANVPETMTSAPVTARAEPMWDALPAARRPPPPNPVAEFRRGNPWKLNRRQWRNSRRLPKLTRWMRPWSSLRPCWRRRWMMPWPPRLRPPPPNRRLSRPNRFGANLPRSRRQRRCRRPQSRSLQAPAYTNGNGAHAPAETAPAALAEESNGSSAGRSRFEAIAARAARAQGNRTQPGSAVQAALAAQQQAAEKARQGNDFYSFWAQRKNGRRFPSYGDFDAKQIAELWPNTMLLSCGAVGGGNVNFTQVMRLTGAAATAEPAEEVTFTPMLTEWMLAIGREAVSAGKPVQDIETFQNTVAARPIGSWLCRSAARRRRPSSATRPA